MLQRTTLTFCRNHLDDNAIPSFFVASGGWWCKTKAWKHFLQPWLLGCCPKGVPCFPKPINGIPESAITASTMQPKSWAPQWELGNIPMAGLHQPGWRATCTHPISLAPIIQRTQNSHGVPFCGWTDNILWEHQTQRQANGGFEKERLILTAMAIWNHGRKRNMTPSTCLLNYQRN